MAFRHSSGPHAGQWELIGRVVRDAPSGKARLYDFGAFQWWLPLKGTCVDDIGQGRVRVYLVHWLYELKVAELIRQREAERGGGRCARLTGTRAAACG